MAAKRILTFKTAEVALLVAATRAATAFRSNYEDLYNPECHFGGKIKKTESGFPDSNNIDPSKLKPALWLVADQGVYLMSNRQLTDEDQAKLKEGASLQVAYAAECDPTGSNPDWYENKRAIMGGDDGADSLPLQWFELAMKDNKPTIRLQIMAKQIRML